jgi:hypothetical protein
MKGGHVEVELLLVPECPNADAARAVLAEAIGRLGVRVAVHERVGDYPSPTVLVDGVDVVSGRLFEQGGAACRMDLPTVSNVVTALGAANGDQGQGPDDDSYPMGLAVGVTSSRVAQVSPAARALHKAILRGFATTGHAPDPADLKSAPVGAGVTRLLQELHDHDVVRLDDHGQIRAAYPFSAVPTAHAVTIHGGPTVWSMCAVDALGIADMVGSSVTINSSDPASGAEIRVEVRSGHSIWMPATAVVVVGSDTTAASTGDVCGPDVPCAVAAADRCCGVMNFFGSPDTAGAWLSAHPEVAATVLTQPQALRLGVDIFGHLLRD